MTNDVWTVKRILDWIEGYLAARDDENPRLSAHWLVSEALGITRIQLFMDPDRPLTLDERDILRDYTRRRGMGEPLQYITGTTDFRFITVQVEYGVLIPRPETEVLVSEALAELNVAMQIKASRRIAFELEPDTEAELAVDENDHVIQMHAVADDEASDQAIVGKTEESSMSDPLLSVIDLCTGTGCIACSIASEVPHAQVVATDIDPKAVALARRNVEALGLNSRVDVFECDLGAGIPEESLGTYELLISNPPYIPTDVLKTMDSEVVDYESSLALDGGKDGLDVFRRILSFGLQALCSDGVLALELHETRLEQAHIEAELAGYQNVRIVDDLAGRHRVLIARKK